MNSPNDTDKKRRRRRRRKEKNCSFSSNNRVSATTKVERQTDHDEGEGEVEVEVEGEAEGMIAFNCLLEAFPASSREEVASAYQAASGDADKAAGILSADPGLGKAAVNATEGSGRPVMPCSIDGPKGRRRRQRNPTVSSGTVSGFLGKDYVRSGSRRKEGSLNTKEIDGGGSSLRSQDEEEFLCSMLGYECQLSLGVVRDIFCQCGYDLVKASDTLLELLASSNEKFMDNIYASSSGSSNSETILLCERYSADLADGITKCKLSEDSLLFGSGSEEVTSSTSYDHRDEDFDLDNHLSTLDVTTFDLSQKVLESLFNISESSEHNPSSMDWKRIVKKMETLREDLKFQPSSITGPVYNTEQARGDDYQVLRRAASEHWDTTKLFYHKAAAAYTRGERGRAAYLSEQGRLFHRKAREADEKASQEIFQARNKDIKNAVRIDLHGQQVKQAIRILKLHLLLFTYIPSVQFLTVITGCGTHGVGKGKIKQSVIALLKKEGMDWSEENRGALVIRLDGRREYSFFQFDSDSG